MARQTPGNEEIELTLYGDARHERRTDEGEISDVDRTRYGPRQHEVEPPEPEIVARIQYEDDHWTDCPPPSDAEGGMAVATPDAETIPC